MSTIIIFNLGKSSVSLNKLISIMDNKNILCSLESISSVRSVMAKPLI